MKFVRSLNRYKFSIIAFIITFFLLGYFFTENVYNSLNARYVFSFTSSSENVEIVLDNSYYDEAIEYLEEEKISYAKIDYKEMLLTAQLSKKDSYELSVLKKYFPTTVKESNGNTNLGEDRIVKYFNLVFSYFPIEITYVGLNTVGYQNPYLIGGIVSGGGFILIITLLLLASMIKKEEVLFEDNQTVFISIFHKEYWKNSTVFLKRVKSLCIVSVLLALMMVCKMLPIPSGFGSLGLSFTYLIFGTIGLIFGPVCGLFVGMCSDLLGYVFFQQGQIFFLGYTLNAMLSGFIYGVCFYKKRITFANCLIARCFVNLVVNVALGSLWWKMIYKLNFDGYLMYMLLTSLPKNIIYLLPQSILLFIFFKLLAKPLASLDLIDRKISENICLF